MKKLATLTAGALASVALSSTVLAGSVKIGSIAAVTGPIPDLIAPVAAARVKAVEIVNAQGGLSSGKLDVVSYDSKCDAKSAVDAANKAVNVDRAIAIVGPSCSGASMAAIKTVMVPAGVATLSDSASAPAYTDLKDNDTAFRAAASDAYQGVALAQGVLADGTKTVAVTYANDDYNIGIAKVFIKAFKAQGGKVVAEQMHEPKKASYRSEVATLAKSKAQALVVFSYYGSGGITIVRNSLENGAFDKFYGGESLVSNELIKQLGFANLDGKFKGTIPTADKTTDSYKAYEGLGVKRAGDPFVSNGFDSAFLMALAIEKANGDKSKIPSALRSVASAPGVVIKPGEWKKAKELIKAGKDINYEGASGNLDFDKNGDVSGIYAWQVPTKDGFQTNKLIK